MPRRGFKNEVCLTPRSPFHLSSHPSSIHSSNKYVWRTYYVSGTALDTEGYNFPLFRLRPIIIFFRRRPLKSFIWPLCGQFPGCAPSLTCWYEHVSTSLLQLLPKMEDLRTEPRQTCGWECLLPDLGSLLLLMELMPISAFLAAFPQAKFQPKPWKLFSQLQLLTHVWSWDIEFKDPRKLKLHLTSTEPNLCAKHLINTLKFILPFPFSSKKSEAQRG